MEEFKITYLDDSKPETKTIKSDTAFSAECKFYKWAKLARNTVRVVSVERIVI